jgi:DNA helicase-2/ATP-dependent DNA helicase PcrA
MSKSDELAEERRLAYVGLTRARQRLYISRAEARTTFGRPEYYPASRFISDIPPEVIEWRRERGSAAALQPETWSGRSESRPARLGPRPSSSGAASFGSATPRPAADVPNLKAGDMITHDKYGLGTVIGVEGEGANQVARIDFRGEGAKRLLVRFAPISKL